MGGFGNIITADYGTLSLEMTKQIQKNLIDETVRDWILPSFSTTTQNDIVVCSVVMMAALQNYFSYKFTLCCGLPEVTLLGTTNDYINLKERVDVLKKYDLGDGKINKWHSLLSEICDELINTSKGNPNMEFWNTICHRSGGGSGPSYLCGWISTFCCFDEKGNWIGKIGRASCRERV